MCAAVPAWLATMRQIAGTRALHDNPVILGWAKEIGELFPDTAAYCKEYNHDSIAWCGLTVAYCLAKSGIKPIFGDNPQMRFLYALAWREFGSDGTKDGPQLGDILVFDFGGGDHHVTMYESTSGDAYICRGGNQSNQVKLSSYNKKQCTAIRRPAQAPANIVTASVEPMVQLMSGITATVFGGSQERRISPYDGHLIDDLELGVALPFRIDDPRPNVAVWKSGRSVICKIVGIGPWNTDDPYWQTGTRPRAEADGRANGAGIDLTPAVAAAIGLQNKGTVDWEFVDPVTNQPATSQNDAVPAPMQQLMTLLEGTMPTNAIPAAAAAAPSTPATDFAAFIQQALGILQALSGQPGTPTPGTTPPPAQTADQIQQFIQLLTALSGGQAGLGPVNGALGQTIGNLLNGKKSAIGIVGALITAVLQAVGPSLGTALPVVGSFAGLGGAALPIFLAIAAWGVLGKLEKWSSSAPAATS
jgi:uncharacterized protein (TIGR02594 family)